jgi:hypothetical protein
MKKGQSKKEEKKKPYSKPSIVFEKIFETAALACGKCSVGAISQKACKGNPKMS